VMPYDNAFFDQVHDRELVRVTVPDDYIGQRRHQPRGASGGGDAMETTSTLVNCPIVSVQ